LTPAVLANQASFVRDVLVCGITTFRKTCPGLLDLAHASYHIHCDLIAYSCEKWDNRFTQRILDSIFLGENLSCLLRRGDSARLGHRKSMLD
jgi:hypothetical protein